LDGNIGYTPFGNATRCVKDGHDKEAEESVPSLIPHACYSYLPGCRNPGTRQPLLSIDEPGALEFTVCRPLAGYCSSRAPCDTQTHAIIRCGRAGGTKVTDVNTRNTGFRYQSERLRRQTFLSILRPSQQTE